MEIRVLEYYIAIVQQKSITRAAQLLHISQSTLSRQIMDLEQELGVTLFQRGRREISLTEDGNFLYRRAQEILRLTQDTQQKILAGQSLSGTLRSGIGEGAVNALILSALLPLIEHHSGVKLDYQTLASDKIFRDIDLGLLDFGVVWTNDNLSPYESLELPYTNHWGAVVPAKDPLAAKPELVAADLRHRRVLLPQQLDVISDLSKYLSHYVPGIRVAGYYDMNYNMLAMVRSGIGIAKDTIDPLLGAKPDEALVRAIAYLMTSHVNILGFHDLMVHDYGPGRRFASVHAEIDHRIDPLIAHEILDEIERQAKKDLHVDLVIHYDPIFPDDPEVCAVRTRVLSILHAIDPRLSFHDFRMVSGPHHVNVIFDMVIPPEYADRTEQLRKQVEAQLQDGKKTYHLVVTFDTAAFNALSTEAGE